MCRKTILSREETAAAVASLSEHFVCFLCCSSASALLVLALRGLSQRLRILADWNPKDHSCESLGKLRRQHQRVNSNWDCTTASVALVFLKSSCGFLWSWRMKMKTSKVKIAFISILLFKLSFSLLHSDASAWSGRDLWRNGAESLYGYIYFFICSFWNKQQERLVSDHMCETTKLIGF